MRMRGFAASVRRHKSVTCLRRLWPRGVFLMLRSPPPAGPTFVPPHRCGETPHPHLVLSLKISYFLSKLSYELYLFIALSIPLFSSSSTAHTALSRAVLYSFCCSFGIPPNTQSLRALSGSGFAPTPILRRANS